jgi:hypothetical protein
MAYVTKGTAIFSTLDFTHSSFSVLGLNYLGLTDNVFVAWCTVDTDTAKKMYLYIIIVSC